MVYSGLVQILLKDFITPLIYITLNTFRCLNNVKVTFLKLLPIMKRINIKGRYFGLEHAEIWSLFFKQKNAIPFMVLAIFNHPSICQQIQYTKSNNAKSH